MLSRKGSDTDATLHPAAAMMALWMPRTTRHSAAVLMQADTPDGLSLRLLRWAMCSQALLFQPRVSCVPRHSDCSVGAHGYKSSGCDVSDKVLLY